MNFDFLKEPGTIVVVISIVIFYARILFLRQEMKRKKAMIVVPPKREHKGSKPAGDEKKRPAVSQDFLNPSYQITNWALGGPGIVLMLIGVVSRTSDWLPAVINPYWYVPTALGVLLLTFSINTK